MLHPKSLICFKKSLLEERIRIKSLDDLARKESFVDGEKLFLLAWEGQGFVWAEAKQPRMKQFFNTATKITFSDDSFLVVSRQLQLPFYSDGPGRVLATPEAMHETGLVLGDITSGTVLHGFDWTAGPSRRLDHCKVGLEVKSVQHSHSSGEGVPYYHISVPGYGNFVTESGVVYPAAR